MGTRSSWIRVCGAVAAPVLAAAFGWTPTARAGGPLASVPAVPPVSASTVVSTAGSVTRTVTGAVSAVPVPKTPVVATVHHIVKRAVAVAPATTTTTHVSRSVPASTAGRATPAAPKRTVRPQQRHRAARSVRTHRMVPEVAPQPRGAKSTGPIAQIVAALPRLKRPGGFLTGPNAGGIGFALLFVALVAALSALAAPGLGRRLMPSIADGRDCALTLDLERPD